MLARPVLLVLSIALLLVACRPTPSDPIQYLHSEESIVIQMLSVDTDASEIERRLVVPEFTLYGDGTLIYQSVSADGTRLLETMLPEDAVRELLEDIVDEGFLDFIYDQPAPEGASSETTFLYGHTRERANAVSVRGAAEPLPEDAGDEFDQYRTIASFVETLRSLDPASAGSESKAYLPEQYLMIVRFLQEPSEPSERILRGSEAAEVLTTYKRAPDSTLERMLGPVATNLERQPDEEIYFAPLLPFYENFPEFDLE